MEQEYFNLNDTATYLGLSSKTLYEWVERKKIPAYKMGRVWRFSRREIEDFVHRKSLYNSDRPLSSALGLGEKEG